MNTSDQALASFLILPLYLISYQYPIDCILPTPMNDLTQSPSKKKKELDVQAPESTRARILDAAAHLIRKKGFKATTVRDIGNAVGLYSGSLFHYFKSKDDILMEVMRTAFISICTLHEQTLASSLTPIEKLRRFIWQEIDLVFIDEEGDYHAVLYFDWRAVAPQHLPELIELRKRYFGSWAEVVRQCHEAGHLKGDPAISVRIIEGTMRGMMSWYRPDGRYSPDEVTDQIILTLAR